jgi:hypothetical protein
VSSLRWAAVKLLEALEAQVELRGNSVTSGQDAVATAEGNQVRDAADADAELNGGADGATGEPLDEGNSDGKDLPAPCPGPFGITLDLHEWKATRVGATVDFAGKECPWRIFRVLCREHPRRKTKDELLTAVWGQGEGSQESLFVHISAVRSLIAPLGVTVECIHKVGYVLVEGADPKQKAKSRGRGDKPRRR